MPWVTVSGPSPAPSPKPTPPPPMARPPLSFEEQRIRDPYGDPMLAIGGRQSPVDPFAFLRGLWRNTGQPLVDLGTLGTRLLWNTFTGDVDTLGKLGMGMQQGSELPYAELGADVGDWTGEPLLGQLASMFAKANPAISAIGMPAVQAGKKIGTGIAEGGDVGARRYEEGLGEAAGLLLPTALDLSAGRIAGGGLPKAAAGLDWTKYLSEMLSGAKREPVAPKVTPTTSLKTAYGVDDLRELVQEGHFAANEALAGRPQDPRSVQYLLNQIKERQPDHPVVPRLEDTLAKSKGELNAGFNPKDAIKKVKDKLLGDEKPVDEGRRSFLKTTGAAAVGSVAPGVPEVAAPTAVAATPSVFHKLLNEARGGKMGPDNWSLLGRTLIDERGDLTRDAMEHFGATPDEMIEGAAHYFRDAYGGDAGEAATQAMQASKWLQDDYGIDPAGPIAKGLGIEPSAVADLVQKHYDALEQESAAVASRMGGQEKVPPRPAIERLRDQGVPNPELRVKPGEPAPKKMLNQTEVDQYVRRPASKLPTRANAGVDLKDVFDEAKKAIKPDTPLYRGMAPGVKSRVPGGTFYTTDPVVGSNYAAANGARDKMQGERWSGKASDLGQFKKTLKLDLREGGLDELNHAWKSTEPRRSGPWANVYIRVEDSIPTWRKQGYDSVLVKHADGETHFIDIRPDNERVHAGLDLLGPFRQARENLEKSRRPVPLTRSERTGSRISSLAERAVEGSFPGSGPFGRFRDAQQEALGKLADSVVESISKFKGSPEALGEHTQKALTRAEEGLKVQAGQLYAEVDDLAGDVKVNTTTAKVFAKELQTQMKAESKLVPPKALERARDIINRIAKAPEKVSFSTAQDARSDLAAMARASGDLIPGKSAGVAKKMAQILDDAMVEAARKSGKPELVEKLRQANAIWKETAETFNESVIGRMVKADPEKVHVLLGKASLEDIRRAKKLLPEHTLQSVKAQMIRDAIDHSMTGEMAKSMFSPETQAKLGITEPKAGQPKLKGPSLKKALERMGEDRLKELFTQKELQGIYSVAETADRVGKNQGGWVSTILNYPLVYGAIQGIQGKPGAAAGTAASYIGINVIARVMTKPWGASVIKEFLLASAQSGARATFWGSRLGELMGQEYKREAEKAKKKASPAPKGSPTPRPSPSASTPASPR